MASTSTFKAKDSVIFRPGPRSKSDVTGTVKEVDSRNPKHVFLVVVCDDGVTRRVRPGACRASV